ncbi:hypothetical protein [Nonomuraea sp. B19D2]|uniref:hypothetical protein n=1 Tax=Nonomuraea sp. B19D2 TaxID=3159561 RepID=UPI0032DB3ABE
MNAVTAATHVTIELSILYFGTPVVLLSTENPDGTFNLAPMSSAWALVRPPRVAECPIQFEARAERVGHDVSGSFVIAEAVVGKVHADPRIVVPGTQHVDPGAWSPLIYNFRHYFGLGPELGHSYRSQTPRTR